MSWSIRIVAMHALKVVWGPHSVMAARRDGVYHGRRCTVSADHYFQHIHDLSATISAPKVAVGAIAVSQGRASIAAGESIARGYQPSARIVIHGLSCG